MNPVLPHLRHNNTFLRPQQHSKDFTTPLNPSNSNYRRIFPNSAAYGPLIPPASSIARAVMGNTNSYQDNIENSDSSGRQAAADTESQKEQQRQPERPRSNLSALMDRQQPEPVPSGTNTSNNQCTDLKQSPDGSHDEADSASGPPPSLPSSTKSASSIRQSRLPSPCIALIPKSSTPPAFIPFQVRPIPLNKSNPQVLQSSDSLSSDKGRRYVKVVYVARVS